MSSVDRVNKFMSSPTTPGPPFPGRVPPFAFTLVVRGRGFTLGLGAHIYTLVMSGKMSHTLHLIMGGKGPVYRYKIRDLGHLSNLLHRVSFTLTSDLNPTGSRLKNFISPIFQTGLH